MVVVKKSFSRSQELATHRALTIDFTQDREVVQVLPSGALLSSQPGQWSGVHLSYYHHPASEISAITSQHHLVLIHLEAPTQVEQWLGTQYQRHHFQVGSVLVIPAHTPHYSASQLREVHLMPLEFALRNRDAPLLYRLSSKNHQSS